MKRFFQSKKTLTIVFAIWAIGCGGALDPPKQQMVPPPENTPEMTAPPEAQTRRIQFTYEFTTPEFKNAEGPIDIFVPLPTTDSAQQIIEEKVLGDVDGIIINESKYGNRIWHARLPKGSHPPMHITHRFTVERKIVTPDTGSEGNSIQDQSIYLAPNDKVPVGKSIPQLQTILSEINADSLKNDPHALAKAIYDWVVANVEYKKVGSGWGNGDTFWACSERYGNCTDFHSLFISLARSVNIPARFEMGFPIPVDKKEGIINGYHCWLQFYVEGRGWIPVDASEAAKHPEQKEYLFGNQPADRVHFSTGRDIQLGEFHQDGPLNYFIYPYIEVNGKALNEKLDQHFSYSTTQ